MESFGKTFAIEGNFTSLISTLLLEVIEFLLEPSQKKQDILLS